MSIKSFRTYLDEASYEGNMGAVEVMKFYQSATDPEIDKLERFIARQDWSKAWKLVQKVTGVNLMGKAFESTLLSEIGDASAKPYKFSYESTNITSRRATFVVKNEDFDASDPKKRWGGIEMFVASRVETILLRGVRETDILEISFGKNVYDSDEKHNTLDIGLKYLFRIMSTVVKHVSNHIEDYNKAMKEPLEGLLFQSSDRKGGRGTARGVKQRDKLYKAYIEKNIRKIAPLAKVIDTGKGILVLFRNDRLLVKP